MSTLNTSDLIGEAARLLTKRIDLDDWQPVGHEIETLDQYEAAEDEERDRRMRLLVEAWCEERTDRLLAIRYVREAALMRASAYREEANRQARRADREKRLADYCETLARGVLVAERALKGESGAYRVELSNGLRMGLRVTQSVSAPDVDALPPELVRTKIVRDPDKVTIGKLLKAGEVVPGAVLVANESVDWGR